MTPMYECTLCMRAVGQSPSDVERDIEPVEKPNHRQQQQQQPKRFHPPHNYSSTQWSST